MRATGTDASKICGDGERGGRSETSDICETNEDASRMSGRGEPSGRGETKKANRGFDGGYSRNKWWAISDEDVVGVDKMEVLSKRKEVYILFYERIE
jgi:hypothetical protein